MPTFLHCVMKHVHPLRSTYCHPKGASLTVPLPPSLSFNPSSAPSWSTSLHLRLGSSQGGKIPYCSLYAPYVPIPVPPAH